MHKTDITIQIGSVNLERFVCTAYIYIYIFVQPSVKNVPSVISEYKAVARKGGVERLNTPFGPSLRKMFPATEKGLSLLPRAAVDDWSCVFTT